MAECGRSSWREPGWTEGWEQVWPVTQQAQESGLQGASLGPTEEAGVSAMSPHPPHWSPTGQHHSDAFAQVNPLRKVPALKDGDFTLAER